MLLLVMGGTVSGKGAAFLLLWQQTLILPPGRGRSGSRRTTLIPRFACSFGKLPRLAPSAEGESQSGKRMVDEQPP